MSYKKNIAEIVGRTFIPHVFDKFQTGVRVLFFHGVMNESKVNPIVQANQMNFEDFKKEISFLHDNYEIISIDSLGSIIQSANIKNEGKKKVVITFDDGYKNNLTLVAPYLKKLNIPFAVFISAKNVDDGTRVPTFYIRAIISDTELSVLNIPILHKKFDISTYEKKQMAIEYIVHYAKTTNNDNVQILTKQILNNISQVKLQSLLDTYKSEELMNWDDVLDIQKYGCTIGSHCLDHCILHSNQSLTEIRSQLSESKKLIEKHIGKCDYFAYPNGDRNSVCDAAIEEANKFYKLAFAVDGKSIKLNNNPFFLSRIGVCDNFYAFKSQISVLSVV